MTDRIATSAYVQGNGPKTETYTDKETAYKIRNALRERFENINIMGLTELVAKFYDLVKKKGSECPDEWFSMQYTMVEYAWITMGPSRYCRHSTELSF
jgi:hypothetical protein